MRFRYVVFIATLLISGVSYGLGWLFDINWLSWVGGAAFAVNNVALLVISFSREETDRARH